MILAFRTQQLQVNNLVFRCGDHTSIDLFL